MRSLLTCGLLAVALNCASATTLQQLTLDQMIQKSTTIVRGTVQLTGAVMHGSYIYTHYTVQVVEHWKGSTASRIDFAVPGGTLNGVRQNIAGAPVPVSGQEYVLYLWTSRSGLTQVIGLSQGLFLSSNGIISRAAISDRMIGANGAETSSPAVRMTLPAMRDEVASVLNARETK